MTALTAGNLMSLEQYAAKRSAFRAEVMVAVVPENVCRSLQWDLA